MDVETVGIKTRSEKRPEWVAESYKAANAIWPGRGQHVLAQFSEEYVVVYQAYKKEIADYAVANGRFTGCPAFGEERMTWIKTNFCWMQFRSGWGRKHNQERTLAIFLKREAFETYLVNARLKGSVRGFKGTIRLQWDPDHNPNGSPHVYRRAVQLGLKGVRSFIEGHDILCIQDVSDFVHENGKLALSKAEQGEDLMVARERVFEPFNQETLCGVLFMYPSRGWGFEEEPEQQKQTSMALTIHPEQHRINQYIMSEMAKLKGENKRLHDEVLALKMQNMQLSSRISTMPTYGLPLEYPASGPGGGGGVGGGGGGGVGGGGGGGLVGSPSSVMVFGAKPQQDLPFVEFDMRRTPPTVQSANVMFCSLLGYTTEEVLGKPWQYFIQDEYVERTIRMLQRDAGAKQMQFGQVYKDRNGRAVPCQDLHTFNRDEKGRVITDYVIVKPEGSLVANNSEPMTMFGGQQQTLGHKRPMPSIMGNIEGFGTSPSLQMMDESDDMITGAGAASPPPPLPLFGSTDALKLNNAGAVFFPMDDEEPLPDVGE